MKMRQVQVKLGSLWNSVSGNTNTSNSSGSNNTSDNSSMMPEEETMSEEFDEMTSLTMQQRIMGFLMSLGMGIIFIIIAMTFVPTIVLFPKKFAFFYSCGSVFCVLSTGFLVGPMKQVKMMFESHRIQAASAYMFCLFMTLVSAVHWNSATLSFVFAGCQIVSVLWYALSFIPFARQVFATTFSYLWIILKPMCSILGSGIAACLKMICSSSSSAAVDSAV